MDDDFSEFERLREVGATPAEVNEAAIENGYRIIDRIRMLRKLFDLSLHEATALVNGVITQTMAEEFIEAVDSVMSEEQET